MLSRLKEDGFFEKRGAILARAKEYGYDQFWFVVPTFLTSVDLEIFHLLFTPLSGSDPSLEQENRFSRALSTEFQLTSDFALHSKNSVEETTIIVPRKADIMKARLQSLIPFEKLLSDVPLEEQERISLEFSSVDVINARLDTYEKEFEQTPISASTAPSNSEQSTPISGAAHEKSSTIFSITQKNLFRDQEETSQAKRLRESHESDTSPSPEKKTQVIDENKQRENGIRH